MHQVLIINFLMKIEKAVFTLGLITLPDKKIKSKKLPMIVCLTVDKQFGILRSRRGVGDKPMSCKL